MVDVTTKAATERVAVAAARVIMSPRTRRLALSGGLRKGPVAETARLAGILAAKKTADLIPLCHPVRIDAVEVAVAAEGRDAIAVRAEVRAFDRTGVEMEALVAVSVAALTVYDMVKAVERDARVEDIRLLLKSGGRSGTFVRPERTRSARGSSASG